MKKHVFYKIFKSILLFSLIFYRIIINFILKFLFFENEFNIMMILINKFNKRIIMTLEKDI